MLGIMNAKLETISNGTIKNGSILIKEGKIVSIGKNIDLSSCNNIIDAHTHLGLSEIGVGSEGRDTNEGSSLRRF